MAWNPQILLSDRKILSNASTFVPISISLFDFTFSFLLKLREIILEHVFRRKNAFL